MNPNTRFNELYHNINPELTIVNEFNYDIGNYTMYNTRIQHNIYANYEAYERIIIRNKLTEHCEAYYLDSRRDQNIYLMIAQKVANVNQTIQNKKRKAEDNINDIEHAFKKMRLDDKMVYEQLDENKVIDEIRQILKRTRETIEEECIEPIKKKQKYDIFKK